MKQRSELTENDWIKNTKEYATKLLDAFGNPKNANEYLNRYLIHEKEKRKSQSSNFLGEIKVITRSA